MLHILLTMLLSILLSILKIIGIILAVVIGILLLVLICGLFVPIKYRVAADGKLGEKHPVHVEIRATWLLHIVNVMFSYRESACLRIRLFCFPLLDSSQKKESGKKRKGDGRRKKNRASGTKNGEEEPDWQEEEISEEKKPETESPETEETGSETAEQERVTDKAADNEDGTEEEVSGITKFFHAVFAFFRKLLEAVKNIEYTIQEICGKIKKVMENIRYYTDLLKSDTFRNVFGNAKHQLVWVCRRIKPGKCRINVRAGMDDPSTTGQIMAAYGILYPLIGSSVSLQPEFEEKVMEGDLYIQGKITGIIFLIAGIRLAVDRNVWKLIKLLKKEGV